MTTRCIHISANQYPKLPVSHHSKVIWKELAKDCNEYHIIARSLDMRFSYSKEGNIHLHLLPSFGKRQFMFFFLSFILPFYFYKIKPSHVIAQCPVLGGFLASLFKSLFSFKLFIELHGEHYFKPLSKNFLGRLRFWFFKMFTAFSFSKADRIRCLSVNMQETVVSVYGECISCKLLVVPNRVDLNKFKTFKKDYCLHNNKLKIITVGRFSALKNHINLIQDLFKLKINFCLTAVGGGDLKSEYLKLFDMHGRQDDLVIYENITHEELSVILPSNDIYVHYSLSEGVPRAILEAMACGLPIVTTNVGYLKGVIADGVTGFIINEPYDLGLDIALKKLSSSITLREAMGTSARRYIETNNEWNHVFSMYRKAVFVYE